MTEPIQCAAMHIMSSLSASVYSAAPLLLPLMVFKQIKLSVTYGNTFLSPYIYSIYGFILCGRVGDIESGYRFGQLALDLVNRLNADRTKAKTIHTVNGFIRHWKEHGQKTLHYFQEAYQYGLETGDFEYAGYAALGYCRRGYITGNELNKLERKMVEYSDACKRFNQETSRNWIMLWHQPVLNLLGRDDSSADSPPCRLIGDSYDEQIMIPFYQKEKNKTALYYIFFNKLILSYLFHDFNQAVENAEIAEQYLEGVTALMIVPLFYYYDSLARLAIYHDMTNIEQEQILEKVSANQKKLENWAHHAPMNYLHKLYLVEAERARVLKKDGDAREYYDKTIDGARENGYLNDEALSCELTGLFYVAKGQNKLAEVYLHDAHYAYRQWGALAKVRHVEEKYSEIIKNALIKEKPQSKSLKTSTGIKAQALDIESILKASNTLAGEIVLENLVKKMMAIVIENAGAQRGCLILKKEDAFFVEFETSVDDKNSEIYQASRLENRGNISESIINYSIRTSETIVLNDAEKEGIFTKDPYIQRFKPKSILCSPLIKQGKLIGLLYLENNLAKNAFSPEKVQVLNLLTAQIAISIENATLYNNLELKVNDRTKELEDANKRLEELSIIDDLTQMHNRRYINRKLEEEVERSKRYCNQLSLAFFDIDHFKMVNDNYGHQKGDEILVAVAEKIKSIERKTDHSSRFGGEEFMLVLPETSVEDARVVCERIRSQIETEVSKKQGVDITISAGVTSFNNQENLQQLIERADVLLYRAKDEGRNRIVYD